MDEDLKKIKKLTSFMRKQGLLHLKQGDIELSLSPGAILPDEKPAADSATAEEPIKPRHTEEEILFWSVQGYGAPELGGTDA